MNPYSLSNLYLKDIGLFIVLSLVIELVVRFVFTASLLEQNSLISCKHFFKIRREVLLPESKVK